MTKESIFSGLNNLKINSILDNKYSEYFGFTSEEVREMAEYYGKPEKYEEICKWYDGYRFGKTEIFNPWSVINYFSYDCETRAFWQLTRSNDIQLMPKKKGLPGILIELKAGKDCSEEQLKKAAKRAIIFHQRQGGTICGL